MNYLIKNWASRMQTVTTKPLPEDVKKLKKQLLDEQKQRLEHERAQR